MKFISILNKWAFLIDINLSKDTKEILRKANEKACKPEIIITDKSRFIIKHARFLKEKLNI